jgi:apolipoprotein N-acyltransferase
MTPALSAEPPTHKPRVSSLLWLTRLSGLLLFASDVPLHWWPLQWVALVPFCYALRHAQTAGIAPWRLGLVLGIFYGLPLLLAAGGGAPVLVAAGLLLIEWPLVAALGARMLRAGPVWGAVGLASVIAFVEIALWRIVPLFGTAPCFARVQSAAPELVQFAAWTGLAGVAAVILGLQALVASLLGPTAPGTKKRPLLALGLTVISLAAVNAWRWTRPLGPAVTVAVAGWGERASVSYEQVFAEAHAAGAHILVTPEEGDFLPAPPLEAARIAYFGQLAAKHSLAAALGVECERLNENHILFLQQDGTEIGRYAKTFLVPFMEDYHAGTGELTVVPMAGVTVGGLICHDDNFTALSRAHASRGVGLMLVPTNDWPGVRSIHLDNSRFRAIESGYAVARATSHGISALISPRGETLAQRDHCLHPDVHLLTASIPTGQGTPTFYAQWGDGPVAGLALVMILATWRRGSRLTHSVATT